MTSIESPYLSVVIPFYNEEDNIRKVCEEVRDVLKESLDQPWELIMVNDGSRDRTGEIIEDLIKKNPEFRGIQLLPNSGQSAALEAGFRVAKGKLIATLDGDGQNDPSDLIPILEEMNIQGVQMMCGIRQKRADNVIRKISSRVANRIRSTILGDNITDVGCSLRVFERKCFHRIKFFRNAHRFFPALFIMAGFKVAEMPVNHRPRHMGTSKYGGGINSRLWVGITDLWGVYWLKKRALRYRIKHLGNRPK